MEVNLLVGMTAEIATGDVACDDDHRDRVEPRFRDAGRRVGQPRPQVRQQNARNPAPLPARIAVGRMRGNLFMPYSNKPNPAFSQSIQKTDNSVSAETKDLLHPPGLQKLHELKRYQVFTHILPHLR